MSTICFINIANFSPSFNEVCVVKNSLFATDNPIMPMSRVPSFPFDTAARDVQTHRQQPFRSPKVVSIPVHFVGSEAASSTPTISRSTAALKIQKVWRGFLVRKSVNKILGIKKEADAIEKRVSDKDSADLIRGDAKERLKLNEMLMALLLRLDSIRGVDPGVRDCRKRVIKKVIMLQERVDHIAFRDAEDLAEESQEIEPENQRAAERSTAEESQNSVAQAEEENLENQKQLGCSTGELEEEVTDAGESVQAEQDQCSEVEEGYLLVKGEAEKDAMECEATAGNVEDKNNKGLMEKMIERNEILIGLVNDLCEKNKMQTQMINSLSNRVDNLEKLFRSKCKRRKQQQLPKCK